MAPEQVIDGIGGPAGLGSLNASFAPSRTDFDWLSRDEAEVDAYIADPLCGFPLAEAAMTSIFHRAAATRHDPRLASISKDLSVLVISGQLDPVTGPCQAFTNALIDSWRAAGITGIEHQTYPGGRHAMFNETNRQGVTADLLDWLGRNVSRRRWRSMAVGHVPPC